MRKLLPSLITLAGHCLTLAWIVGDAPVLAGVAGLALDAVDGATARHLNACTPFGSLYDWTVDVTCVALIVGQLNLTFLLPLIVVIQAECRRQSFRFSGRAALTVFAMGMRAWHT